jgi:hypothetical protein
LSPEVKDLVWRAVEATKYPGTDAVSFYRELTVRIAERGLGCFVGYEGDRPATLAIALLPTSRMMMAPQIVLVYSGGAELTRKVGVRLREWLLEEGHKEALACNLAFLDRPDRVFMRVFRHFGKPEFAGSLIRFKF